MVTLTSTLLAFIMTPLWCQILVGKYVPVDGSGLAGTTFQAVVAPVLLGVFLNGKCPNAIASASHFGLMVSVSALIFIAGSIVAQSSESVIANAGKLTLAATLLHLKGFLVGYTIAKLLWYDGQLARTISIEVGMQNGGMAAVTAKTNFPMDPMVAIPAVFSSMVQTFIGSLFAAYWRRRPIEVPDAETFTGSIALPSDTGS